MRKQCSKCKRLFVATSSNFWKDTSRSDGLHPWCKECARATRIAWNRRNSLHIKQWHRKHDAKARDIVLTHYSNGLVPRCACCGETHYEFLQLDHIYGAKDPRYKGFPRLAAKLAHVLIRKKFPSGFRVLCANCNAALGTRGYCPHQFGLIEAKEA